MWTYFWYILSLSSVLHLHHSWINKNGWNFPSLVALIHFTYSAIWNTSIQNWFWFCISSSSLQLSLISSKKKSDWLFCRLWGRYFWTVHSSDWLLYVCNSVVEQAGHLNYLIHHLVNFCVVISQILFATMRRNCCVYYFYLKYNHCASFSNKSIDYV